MRRSYRDLPATYGLLAAIAAMYVLEGNILGQPSVLRLVDLGAQVNGLVVTGGWWRIVTAMFLHLNWLHILLNGWSLFVVGELVEPALGTRDYLVVYFLGGIMGGLFSLVAYPANEVLVGASGAIFGLLGATAVIAWQARGPARGYLLRWVGGILVLNLAFDFMNPSIGVWDHIGGLVGGFLATLIVGAGFRLRGTPRIVGSVVYAVLAVALVVYARLLWI